ncbi:sugar fermentation stimulation protein homolog [Ylistrum balloti]|uniref:sugar fermentation stimulation protein homolog n=1 Tax=Ylistrum balloti TaxID=509963 RepID=UPI0029059FC8|nr:sugar fermentation stimulation protein homolog [Ylistrum balloti]
MKRCFGVGWPVLLSQSDNPKRKLPYTLEFSHNGASWICVHPASANQLVEMALKKKMVEPLASYTTYRREVRYGQEQSRIDFLLEGKGGACCYVEVKSVSMIDDTGRFAIFPDSISKRGQKHLRELMYCVEKGSSAAALFVIQRTDIEMFRAAQEIDSEYAKLLLEAKDLGVQFYAYQTTGDPFAYELQTPLKIQF